MLELEPLESSASRHLQLAPLARADTLHDRTGELRGDNEIFRRLGATRFQERILVVAMQCHCLVCGQRPWRGGPDRHRDRLAAERSLRKSDALLQVAKILH